MHNRAEKRSRLFTERHMKVYADNAATTKMSKTAIKAMLPYFDGCYANSSSLHTPGQLAKDALASARGYSGNAQLQAERDIFHIGRQRVGQSSDNFGGCGRRAQGQKAHNIERDRTSRGFAYFGQAQKTRVRDHAFARSRKRDRAS